MTQHEGEAVREFQNHLWGKAEWCEFTVNCTSSGPNLCAHEVSYINNQLFTQLLWGLQNNDLQRKSSLRERKITLDKTMAVLESLE